MIDLLLLEINQIFVVKVNPHIREASPRLLNLLSRNRLLRFLCLLLPPLQASTPRPLNLDSTNVVHGKSVILKQPSSQTHLISRLNQSRAKVLQTAVLILGHDVERRR